MKLHLRNIYGVVIKISEESNVQEFFKKHGMSIDENSDYYITNSRLEIVGLVKEGNLIWRMK